MRTRFTTRQYRKKRDFVFIVGAPDARGLETLFVWSFSIGLQDRRRPSTRSNRYERNMSRTELPEYTENGST
jgi:hypothetical protein